MSFDVRATAWHHLFPSGTAFTAHSGPAPFRDAVGILGTGDRGHVLVLWDEDLQNLPGLDSCSGVVAVNGRNISRRRLRELGFPYVRRFALLPGIDDPRWFIPAGGPRVAERALRLNTPVRLIPRLKHLGVRLAAGGGLSPLFRNQVIIAQRSTPPLERALAGALGTTRFELSISTGTPGPARKPTIAVLSPGGTVLAFVKLSGSAISRELIEREARCLRALHANPALAPLAPDILFDGEIDGAGVLAQRSLPGTMPGVELTAAHRAFLDGLENGPPRPAADTHLVRTLGAQVGAIREQYPDVAEAFRRARQVLDGVTVRQTVLHGDLTPWNLRLRDGVISAFDWEYGDLDGLPLLDEMHYRWQPGLRLKRWREDDVFDYFLTFRSDRHPEAFEPAVLHALQVMGVLHVLMRKITEGHPTTTRFFGTLRSLVQRLLPYLDNAPLGPGVPHTGDHP